MGKRRESTQLEPNNSDTALLEKECPGSGFMGRPIASLNNVKTSVAAKLEELAITDAEQIVAVASLPDVRDYLLEALSISNQELEAIVRNAREALPSMIAAEVEAPAPESFGLGVLPPTPEMAAVAEAEAAAFAIPAVALPPSTNLISRMPSIRNQASRGTCVAFTVTAMHDYATRLPNGQPRNFSEQHAYYETKLIDGASNACGTWQAKAALALANRGQCLETVWPYNPNPPCNNHGPRPVNARPNGLLYRFRLVAVPTRSVPSIKAALAARKPVGVSIPVYNSWYQSAETRRTGRINMRIGSEPSVGGHAVCLVGYQDSPTSPGGGYFLVRNSWSTTWGYQCPYGAGYGTIPYQYIANENWEAYSPFSIVSQEDDQEREERDDDRAQPVNGSRTLTIRVKGNVNLIIE